MHLFFDFDMHFIVTMSLLWLAQQVKTCCDITTLLQHPDFKIIDKACGGSFTRSARSSEYDNLEWMLRLRFSMMPVCAECKKLPYVSPKSHEVDDNIVNVTSKSPNADRIHTPNAYESAMIRNKKQLSEPEFWEWEQIIMTGDYNENPHCDKHREAEFKKICRKSLPTLHEFLLTLTPGSFVYSATRKLILDKEWR